MENKHVVISVVIVLVVFFSGIVLFSYKSSLESTGYAITSGQAQCEDTDNNRPVVGPRSEQDFTDTIFVKGGVRTKPNSYSLWSELVSDSCFGNVLTETFCNPNGKISNRKVTCENGCTDGKCNLPKCVDSDGPRAYSVKGTVTGGSLTDSDFMGVPPKLQSGKTYTDVCKSRLVLSEYYCEKNAVKKRTMSCPSVGSNMICSEGACVESDSV